MTSDAVVTACGVDEIFADRSFAQLCKEAAAECANPDVSAPAPDRELYRTLEGVGSSRCFAAYARLDHPLDADRLIGFALVLLAPSAHNGKRYATVESLFVGREHRASGAGPMLMGAVEGAARAAGCEAICYSAHVGSRLAKLLFLQADRYTLTNHIFLRRLT